MPIVKEQLQKTGVRLADLPDKALGEQGMRRLRGLSIIAIAISTVTAGLLLAAAIGSRSVPLSGILGASAGLFCFGLLIRVWAQ